MDYRRRSFEEYARSQFNMKHRLHKMPNERYCDEHIEMAWRAYVAGMRKAERDMIAPADEEGY